MKRKVIKQGHNTLTITLPVDWARKCNIDAGDELQITEREKALLVTTDKMLSLPKTEVDINKLPTRLLWRFVSAAYRSGYDEIRIDYKDAEKGFRDLYTAFSYNTLDVLQQRTSSLTPAEAIYALINRFVGVEIIDQKRNYCIVKELGETSYKEFNSSLRRIFLLILSMADECLEAVKGSKDGLRSIHMVDTNVDRFEDFCLRVLNKTGYEEFKKTPTVYTTIFLLELVGDEYKRLAIHLFKLKKINPQLFKVFERINNQTKNFYDLYYNFKKEKTIEIFTEEEELSKLVQDLYPKLNSDEKELLHHLKKISRFAISLTELRIDMEG